ncbi:MAG TPA: hypothetical protein VJH68_01950 [Candidatus Nanoarchaeia archaeon]|nr:hypothetical protein [Candidatus Nanoarchaeia archaeon]
MGKIGFKSVDESTLQKKDDSLKYLGQVLRDVEQESEQLEADLKAEIKSLDHLRENVKLLENQILQSEEYLKKRRDLLLQVLSLESAPEFAVEEVRDLLERINHLDQIISRKVNLVGAEIRRYILNDTAQILTENVQHQSQIARIDALARRLLASVSIISAEVSVHNDSLKRIYRLVRARESQTKVRDKDKIGY